MVAAARVRSRVTLVDVLPVRDFLEMRRAGEVGTVARFGAALLGGVALLTWFESHAQSQASQGVNSLPPVTVDAPTLLIPEMTVAAG